MAKRFAIMLLVLCWVVDTWPNAYLWWAITHDWMGVLMLLWYPVPIPLYTQQKEK